MTDDMDMTNETTTETLEREESPDMSRADLVRPLDRRIIAGVASGLADYWGVSVGLVRFATIVLSVFGGLGMLLYLAGWLLIPNDDGTESIGEEAVRKARSGESWIGIVLIGLAALIGLSAIGNVDTGFAWAIALGVVGYLLYRGDLERSGRASVADRGSSTSGPETVSGDVSGGGRPPSNRAPRPPRPPREPRAPRVRRERSMLGRLAVAAAFVTMGTMSLVDSNGYNVEPRHYIGALLLIVAISLLVGTFVGRARWLIIPGIILLPFAAITSVWDSDWANGVTIDGDFVDETIVGTDGLDSRYQFDGGSIVFDLSEVEDLGDLVIDMGVGELKVFLPDDAEGLNLSIDLGAGEASIYGADASAYDLDLQVGIGDISTPFGRRSGLGVDFDRSGTVADISMDVGVGAINIYGSDGNS